MSLATSESDYVYQMERIFKDHLTQIQAPGFSVAVIKNGKVILAKGYGKKVINQNQPMDENTILSIGSLTKSFTAMAILQLQEKGALNIDDPVVKYLPWFRSSDKALSDTITLRMMLNNASGLSPRFSILSNNTSRRPDALEKGVRAMSSYEIKRKPGESFEYLNEGWNTLGLIIEKISGLTWEEYIEQNILQPLNMSKSSAERKVIEQWDVAKGHYSGITPVAADLIHIQGSLPAGSGFFSNVIDLSHYLTALVKGGKFNGQTLLNEKSLKDLWKPTVAVTGLSKEMGGDGKPAHYAMGWFVFDIDGERYISHGGEARTSSSQAMIDPIHNSAVVILYNTGNLESYSNESNLYVSHNILRILKDMPLSQFAIPVEADPLLNYFLPAKDNLDHYHGVYLSGSGKRMRIQAGGSEGLQMFLQDTIYPSDLDVDFINDTSFVMRNIAQRIQGHFTYNEDGTVASLVWGGETFSKKQNRDNQKYTSYQSDKEDISFALPPRWNVVWDDTVFNASVSGASDLQLTGQIVSLEFEDWLAQAGLPNDTEEISELRNGYIYQGAIVTDDQAEKKRIFLYCRTQNQKYGFILTVPEGQLTHEIIQTLNPFLDSLDLY
ncbi:MAG: beta-lactamase family protein [Emcibacter sp.]|nr:beta-lactamase family protein [Emcibacter sp.]